MIVLSGLPGDSAASMLLVPLLTNLCLPISRTSRLNQKLTFVLEPLRFLEDVTSRYKPIVGLIMGGEEIIFVADPATAQQVLIDKASIYRKVHSHHQPPCAQS